MPSSWAQKIDAKRKRYNPEVEGFGNPHEWTSAFYERMGVEEAEQVLHGNDQSPRGILGVTIKATWDEIVRAYRKLALATHPDRAALNGMTVEDATEKFKTVNAAYAVLAREFGK